MNLLETLVPPLRRAREQVDALRAEVDLLKDKERLANRRRRRAEERLEDAQSRLRAGNLPLCPECGTTRLRDIYQTNGPTVKRQYQCENLHNLTVYGRFADVRVTSRERR